jgi:nitrogenase molybdenum-iron protein alpha/beta subunit
MFEELTLDDLLIRSSSHTPFFGVYLATHAVRDALCMCHASVGCKVKTQTHVARHDSVEDGYRRMRYSQFIDEDLINGSTVQLEEEIRAWSRRQRPGIVVLDASTPISLQGQGMAAVIQRMEAEIGVPVVFVDARNYEDDLYGGYAQTIGTLLERLDWSRRAPRADEVSVVGHFFDRYEPDQLGNVAELRRLLAGIGLRAPAVFFAGEPFATLQEAVHARTHLVLPHAASQVGRLDRLGQVHVQTGLPMGITGTTAWLRQVAGALSLEARVQPLVDAELRAAKRYFEVARRNLQERRFAVFAEAPRAAGVVATLMEVGMVPSLIGVLHFSAGGRAEVERALAAHHGVALPTGVHFLENPTSDEIRGADYGECDVALGTTIERELLGGRFPWVEFGFPSETRHFLAPRPCLGFQGALCLLEQVMAATEAERVGLPPGVPPRALKAFMARERG